MEETTTTATKRQHLTTKLISSNALPDLPFELVSEILYRLPVKLLLQLRCLSKSFNTLISDPNFAKKHLRLSTANRNPIITYLDTYDKKSTLIFNRLHSIVHPHRSNFNSATAKNTQLDCPFDPLYNKIAGSCNGILCLAIRNFNIDKKSHVLLFNPFISKFKILPSFKFQRERVLVKYGFGYDHVTDVYKVVALFSYDCVNKVSKTQGMVYALGTNSWRMIHGDLPPPGRFDYKLLIFVSGALNWISYEDNDNHSVVSFDLAIESYRRLLPPNYGGECVHYVILGVLRDCLCFVARGLELSNVWLMKEYGNEESWTKLFRVPDMNGSVYSLYAMPIWIYEDDQVLMDYTIPGWRKFLAVYDFKNGNFKKTVMLDINGAITSEFCFESLISPCF